MTTTAQFHENTLDVFLREPKLTAAELRLFACDCAWRAVRQEIQSGRRVDSRCVDAIDVGRRFARMQATAEELKSAYDAAFAASCVVPLSRAASASWSCCHADAGKAAREAAWDASASHTNEAENRRQAKELDKLIQF